ncbi:MAG: AEC family transporter [Synechococcus sp.]|nr:AEC family transporter [Synechococcus sp.]
MADVLLALGLLALLGSLLRYWLPDFDVEAARRSIGVLVLNVFLPALVFRVICSVPSGPEMVQIPLVMGIGVLCCLGLALLLFRPLAMPGEEKGALVLASAFGNVTYLGLPVLQGLFPGLSLQVAKVAILSEVTTTPLNLSVGVALGESFSGKPRSGVLRQAFRAVATMPALWAIVLALAWTARGVPVPGFLMETTRILGNTVTGLMMLSLGMGLRYRRIHQPLPLLLASAIKLLVSPLVVFAAASWIGLQQPYLQSVVLEGAMPTQLLTFVIADRVGLDVERLAVCILINTAASFVTIPLLNGWLFD